LRSLNLRSREQAITGHIRQPRLFGVGEAGELGRAECDAGHGFQHAAAVSNRRPEASDRNSLRTGNFSQFSSEFRPPWRHWPRNLLFLWLFRDVHPRKSRSSLNFHAFSPKPTARKQRNNSGETARYQRHNCNEQWTPQRDRSLMYPICSHARQFQDLLWVARRVPFALPESQQCTGPGRVSHRLSLRFSPGAGRCETAAPWLAPAPICNAGQGHREQRARWSEPEDRAERIRW
jgi:hypothetical protein